jgi:hypothetical protein
LISGTFFPSGAKEIIEKKHSTAACRQRDKFSGTLKRQLCASSEGCSYITTATAIVEQENHMDFRVLHQDDCRSFNFG